MIGYLEGKIIDKTLNTITLLCGSVGYEVLTTQKIIDLSLQTTISLYCYTHVREDQLIIFGFEDKQQKDLFKKLISVSGVGPKTALLVIDTLGVNETVNAIKNADITILTTVPGLGKKSAQKVVVELQNKLGEVKELDLLGDDKVQTETIDALVNLGFKKDEIILVLKNVDKNLAIEEQIKIALTNLGG